VDATPINVLVVDDEPHICKLLCDGLSGCGFHCVATSVPGQARELLASQPFSVMVADISMPELTGLDLLLFARQHAPECKMILITGHPDAQYLADAISLGAYDFFQKPFKIHKLLEAVCRAAGDGSMQSRLTLRAAKAMQELEQLRQTSIEAIKALVRAVEAKDPYTRKHSEQVAHYAGHIADYLGLDAGLREVIHTASLLHDVGKIGVPDNVLTKPGALTDEEFAMVKRHPALGEEILQKISVFAKEARLVRHHHENWDGSGYPDGLKGEQIPLGARVINVADSIDAMLMKRTYKGAYSLDKTRRELLRCSGSQFDPELAQVAVEWSCRYPESIILPGGRWDHKKLSA